MTFIVPDLPTHVLQLLAQVPKGKVTTYGALAQALGDAVAARWVGGFLLDHAHHQHCACHRVVQATGAVGNHIHGDALLKRQMLQGEGVGFHADKINLDHYGFSQFESVKPLLKLRDAQLELSRKISLAPPKSFPDVIGGVDVSYTSDGFGVAAYVNIDANSGQRRWATTVRKPVDFPFISSYLAFRELPLLLAVIDQARQHKQLAPVVLVDGTGILHPRGAGIASHLGVLADLPTIGVTKKRLTGEVTLTGLHPHQPRTVYLNDQPKGIALQSKRGVKPIYLSPGHRMSVNAVEGMLMRLFKGHKLPEPLFWADRLSREAAKSPSHGGLQLAL